MIDVSVEQSERALLHQWADSRLILERAKAMAVLLAADGGSYELIASFVRRSVRTVKTWITSWRKYRMASIFTGHADNLNASYVDSATHDAIVDMLSRPPSEFRVPAQFWTVPDLADLCQATFDLEYKSNTSWYLLFRAAGLSFKYPDKLDRHRDDEGVKQAMVQVNAQVVTALADPDTVVFAADEVKVQREAIVRKAWLPKGQKTVIKVDRVKESQSYIGFLNQRTFRCSLQRMERQNSKEVVKALRRLTRAHPRKKIVIVWDNASFHKSKELRDALTQGGSLARIHLIALPPYAPDHNPIEHVWKDSKEKIANRQRETFDDTLSDFETYARSGTFEYKF